MEFGDKEHMRWMKQYREPDPPITRCGIRMTTANGEFWWTGRMTDKDINGHGEFTTFGWSEKCEPSYMAVRRSDALKKAAHLESSLRRMFAIDRIEVVPVQWSSVFGFQPAEEIEQAA